MASLVPKRYIAHLALLLLAFSGVHCQDFDVCFTYIGLDSSWEDSYYGVHPYAELYVNDVLQDTTAYPSSSWGSRTVTYDSSAYCVELNEGDEYKVTLWESNTGLDDEICSYTDTINAADDTGLNTHWCNDDNSNSNYCYWQVTAITEETTESTETEVDATEVTIDGVEYIGSTVGTVSIGGSVSEASCRESCAASSSCNYLSLTGTGYSTACKMFNSYDSVEANDQAISVSYVCEVAEPDWLEDDYCDTAGEYNTQDCGWDGGACCVENTNGAWTDDDCLDPLNQDTPSEETPSEPTAQPTPEPTTAGSDDDMDLSLCEFILDNVGDINYYQIGDGNCDTSGSSLLTLTFTLNGNGGSTEINDATCNWDGGDCCMATNNDLSTNDNCLNPLYATESTPSPTTPSTPSPTTGGYQSSGQNSNQNSNQNSGANSNTLIGVVLVATAATMFH
eukprot:118570_1